MTIVYVALGSNTEQNKHLNKALDLLKQYYGSITISPVYRNKAVGFEGEDFLNLVAVFETDQDVAIVAETFRDIEKVCGRDRALPKFGPRTLDLDLLLFGEAVLDLGNRHIPRSEILEFAFVLCPLADIAPNLEHPETGRTIAAHWAGFDQHKHTLRLTDLSSNADKK